MSLSESRSRKRTITRVGVFLLYLTTLAVLLSPQFSLTGDIGPSGLLRADQLIIPSLVIILSLINLERVKIPVTRLSLGLLAITAVITISLILNIFLFDLDPAAGDLFDILIWCTYAVMFMIVGGNVSPSIAEQCFKLILLVTAFIGIFALLQAIELQFAVKTIGELYTTRSPRSVGLSPTGTTSNPNTLGKLVLVPLFAFFALLYRSLAGSEKADPLRTVLWGGGAFLFGSIIIISDSRSALGAAVVGIGIIGCALVFGRIGDPKRRKLVISGSAIAVFSALILAIFVLEIGRIGNLQHPLQDDSLQRRFIKWKSILPIILERPLVGHGPSKQFVEKVSFRYIDSGVLSWFYHYGVMGVLSYLYLVLGAVHLGVRGLTDTDLFRNRPILWSASVAVLGWFSGTLAAWTVAGVPQSRRVFTFALLITALVSTYYYRYTPLAKSKNN